MDYITPILVGFLSGYELPGRRTWLPDGFTEKNERSSARFLGMLLFRLGRFTSVFLLGIIFGMFGRGLRLAGLLPWTSILLGSAMVVGVAYPFIFGEPIRTDALFRGSASRRNIAIRPGLSRQSALSFFTTGLRSRLLPSSLFFVAVAGAISTGQVWDGVLFMILFEAGNLLLIVTKVRQNPKDGFHSQKIRIRKVIPFFIFVTGILFILRGMSLGVPYLSPSAEKLAPKTITEKKSCCN